MHDAQPSRPSPWRHTSSVIALCCFGIASVHCTTPGSTQDPATDGGNSTGLLDPSSGTGEETTSGSTTGGTDAPETTSGWTAGNESGETGDPPSLDEQLAELLAAQAVPVVPLSAVPAQDPALVALGEALFFDPILSGNMDTACSSCHHPAFGSSDGLSLTLGTGAVGVGPARAQGAHPPFVPRNSQALFNIGDPSFTRMFWDGRVELDADGALQTPAGADLLPGLDSALAAQAMFPVLDRQEMRGQPGDLTVLGGTNELAVFVDEDPAAIWAALMDRLGAIEAYVELFGAAFPDQAFDTLTFADAANAIAAYESEAFSFPNSPWDEYLGGTLPAISDAAKVGALRFYGPAGCGECHSGPLLTDHEFHSTGVPQLGPGRGTSAPFDHGRELVTGDPQDRFSFRTPSLRNVEVSAPYMHNGALIDFERTLVHYASPTTSIEDFETKGLLRELVPTLQQDPEHIEEVVATLSRDLVLEPSFIGLSNIREFLETLTDPGVVSLEDIRPKSVPSGLPVP
ncbi:MAG: cytochrome-c peroxidase [Nannocystales bacterium]